MLQKFVCEIRFVPNPKFLDIRGEIASAMSNDKLKQWKISKDRVDVSGKEGVAFASYSNLGFITLEEKNIDDCIKSIDEAIKILGDLPPVRWGVRIYSISPSRKKFPTLLNKCKNKLLNFNPKNFSKIDGQLEDLGISYIFSNGKDKFQITIGPMEKKQSVNYFPEDKLPKNGIFVDLDIYRDGDNFYQSDFRRARIKDFINNSFTKSKEIISEIMEVING